MMAEVTYREAIVRALGDALAQDDSVFLLGEDIGAAGGVFKTTAGLQERFGSKRVRDTPISEQAIIGLAVGSAVQGLRPVAEIMFADFIGVAFDQVANQLAKYRYMTGGQVTVPATIRLINGMGGGFAAQHSQTAENWFLSIPGLKLVTPGTPADAYGLLRAAIEDDDPVLVFEHKGMFNVKGELAENPERLEIGKASVVRPGSDVTVVANQLMLGRALDAAEMAAEEGLSLEVIDPRTVMPLDFETIGESLERTNNLVVVQEATASGSWGATLVARMIEERFDSFDSPPVLLAGEDTPIGYAATLENAWAPSAQRILDAVRINLAIDPAGS